MKLTKDILVEALDAGMTADEIIDLLNDAVDVCEANARLAKLKSLAEAVTAYIGPDHGFWNDNDPYDVAAAVATGLDSIVASMPVVNCTEHKCSCGDSCSCDDKIMAKMVIVDENGNKKVTDMTADEANEVLAGFLESLGLR